MNAATFCPAWLYQGIALADRARKLFDARPRRDRIVLLAVAVAAIVLLADTLWITPAFKHWSNARARHSTATLALQRLNDDIQHRSNDARALEEQMRHDLVQLRERVKQGDSDLRGGAFIAAADMVPVLDHLLAQVGGLRLRSMQSLARVEVAAGASGAAVVAAAPSAASAPASAGPTLYRHGVELTVEGSYVDLLAYLRALEAMPQQVLWAGLQMKVEQHPRASLTLRLYTLSLDRMWLEI